MKAKELIKQLIKAGHTITECQLIDGWWEHYWCSECYSVYYLSHGHGIGIYDYEFKEAPDISLLRTVQLATLPDVPIMSCKDCVIKRVIK